MRSFFYSLQSIEHVLTIILQQIALHGATHSHRFGPDQITSVAKTVSQGVVGRINPGLLHPGLLPNFALDSTPGQIYWSADQLGIAPFGQQNK
jgi:hypothetical protein